MLCIIDNYDSFTFNLVHYVEKLGEGTEVYRNDHKAVDDTRAAWVVIYIYDLLSAS